MKTGPIPISKKCRLCKSVKLLNQFEIDDKAKDKHVSGSMASDCKCTILLGLRYGISSTRLARQRLWVWLFRVFSSIHQQGLSDAEAGLAYDCFKHTQYYCNGYSQGFNTYENNSQQQTQTQGAEINVKDNSNYIGVNQEQISGIGSSYPALREDNNGNGNGYDSSIQSDQANPSCKVVSLTIVR
jgi:hypothetical protein